MRQVVEFHHRPPPPPPLFAADVPPGVKFSGSPLTPADSARIKGRLDAVGERCGLCVELNDACNPPRLSIHHLTPKSPDADIIRCKTMVRAVLNFVRECIEGKYRAEWENIQASRFKEDFGPLAMQEKSNLHDFRLDHAMTREDIAAMWEDDDGVSAFRAPAVPPASTASIGVGRGAGVLRAAALLTNAANSAIVLERGRVSKDASVAKKQPSEQDDEAALLAKRKERIKSGKMRDYLLDDDADLGHAPENLREETKEQPRAKPKQTTIFTKPPDQGPPTGQTVAEASSKWAAFAEVGVATHPALGKLVGTGGEHRSGMNYCPAPPEYLNNAAGGRNVPRKTFDFRATAVKNNDSPMPVGKQHATASIATASFPSANFATSQGRLPARGSGKPPTLTKKFKPYKPIPEPGIAAPAKGQKWDSDDDSNDEGDSGGVGMLLLPEGTVAVLNSSNDDELEEGEIIEDDGHADGDFQQSSSLTLVGDLTVDADDGMAKLKLNDQDSNNPEVLSKLAIPPRPRPEVLRRVREKQSLGEDLKVATIDQAPLTEPNASERVTITASDGESEATVQIIEVKAAGDGTATNEVESDRNTAAKELPRQTQAQRALMDAAAVPLPPTPVLALKYSSAATELSRVQNVAASKLPAGFNQPAAAWPRFVEMHHPESFRGHPYPPVSSGAATHGARFDGRPSESSLLSISSSLGVAGVDAASARRNSTDSTTGSGGSGVEAATPRRPSIDSAIFKIPTLPTMNNMLTRALPDSAQHGVSEPGEKGKEQAFDIERVAGTVVTESVMRVINYQKVKAVSPEEVEAPAEPFKHAWETAEATANSGVSRWEKYTTRPRGRGGHQTGKNRSAVASPPGWAQAVPENEPIVGQVSRLPIHWSPVESSRILEEVPMLGTSHLQTGSPTQVPQATNIYNPLNQPFYPGQAPAAAAAAPSFGHLWDQALEIEESSSLPEPASLMKVPRPDRIQQPVPMAKDAKPPLVPRSPAASTHTIVPRPPAASTYTGTSTSTSGCLASSSGVIRRDSIPSSLASSPGAIRRDSISSTGSSSSVAGASERPAAPSSSSSSASSSNPPAAGDVVRMYDSFTLHCKPHSKEIPGGTRNEILGAVVNLCQTDDRFRDHLVKMLDYAAKMMDMQDGK